MEATWWWVQPPIGVKFLVLVVGGKIAVTTEEVPYFIVGQTWDTARKTLEAHRNVCTMAAS